MYDTPAFQGYLAGGIEDENGKVLGFPVDVEPGKSVRLMLRIFVPIKERAAQLISEAYPSGSRLMMRDLTGFLDRQGTDFWDNAIMTGTGKRESDGSVRLDIGIGQDPYRIKFRTQESGSRVTADIVKMAPGHSGNSQPQGDVGNVRFVKQPPDQTPYLVVTFTSARGNTFQATAQWY